jgi:hypothetical protein
MIPSLAEIVSSIRGGAQLLCFRFEGLKPLKRDEDAPARSFFVMLLALPAFLFLLWRRYDLGMEEKELHFYATWLLTYLVSWLAFPVVLFALAGQLPLRRALPFFIQARNWILVPGIYASLAAFWLADSRLLPGDLSELLGFLVEAWILAVEWWLVRRILAASAGQAVLLILIDFMLDYALFAWAIGRTALPLAGG